MNSPARRILSYRTITVGLRSIFLNKILFLSNSYTENTIFGSISHIYCNYYYVNDIIDTNVVRMKILLETTFTFCANDKSIENIIFLRDLYMEKGKGRRKRRKVIDFLIFL